ncbi:uncharacterized protein TNCV_2588901 [Trichonephila clavipes]|nr:uncharacterized protein TNCV_2588901 [Trichonephila clavipes]
MFIITRESLVLAIWHSVHAQRKEIKDLIQSLLKISYLSPKIQRGKWKVIFYACLITAYVYPIFVASMMVGLLSHSEAEEYETDTIFVTIDAFPHVMAFIIHCMYNFYLLTLPQLVSFLYIFICFQLSRMTNYMTDILLKCQSLERIILLYQDAMKLFFVIEKVENSMSTCMFFVVALNLALSFTSFAYGLGYYEMSRSASSGVLSWFLSNQVSFLLIVLMASSVVYKCKTLKSSFDIVLTSMELSDQTSMLFLQKVNIFDSISLTGWRMFEFSKGLILSATGAILTYGLLLLQTDNYVSQKTPRVFKG